MQRMSRVYAGGCFPPKGQVCYNRGDPEANLAYGKLETKHHRSRPTLRVASFTLTSMAQIRTGGHPFFEYNC